MTETNKLINATTDDALPGYRFYTVPTSATYADGSPLKGAFSSDSLSQWIAENIGARYVYAARLTEDPDLLLLCGTGSELTDAEINALVTNAQNEPGFPVWGSVLTLWGLRPGVSK